MTYYKDWNITQDQTLLSELYKQAQVPAPAPAAPAVHPDVISAASKLALQLQKQITPAPTAAPAEPAKPGEEKKEEAPVAGKPGAFNLNILKELALSQPFNSNDINVDRLIAFAKKYAALANNTNVNNVANNIIPSIVTPLNNEMMYPGQPLVVDTMTPQFVGTLVKQKSYQNMTSFISHLTQLVQAVGGLYQNFYTQYGPMIEQQLGSSAFNMVAQQIVGSGSPYYANVMDLQRIQAKIHNEIPQK